MNYKDPVLKCISNGFLVCADKYEAESGGDEYSSQRYMGREEVYFKANEESQAMAKLKEFAKSAGIFKGMDKAAKAVPVEDEYNEE